MTKRKKLQEEYKEYQKALRKLERKKPGAIYQIAFDSGVQHGTVEYDPDSDSIRIAIPRGYLDVPGGCLYSLCVALRDLLSEAQ